MKFKSDIEVQAGLKDSSGAVGTSGQVLSSTASGVSWITQSISGYVPYTGATANVNLGAYSITADSFIKIGGTADQYLKADGSVSTAMNSRVEADFVATSGQTTFVTPYEVGQIDVYYNGSKLYPNEFTATNGTDVVLAQAATLGAQISIVKYVSSFTTTSIRNESVFTTTGGQTTFAVNYAIGQVDVFYNGSKLSPTEFTATNGTSVVLGFACAAGESIVIDSFVNQVSGAVGTANKVAKFTGVASLGDSQIDDNGTNVSVGYTTNPNAYKLDVNGTGRFNGKVDATRFVSNETNGYGLILNRPSVTTYNGMSLQTANSAKWFLGMRENLSSNNYVIYNENTTTDVLTINSSNNNVSILGGKLGVGINIPTYSFQVQKTSISTPAMMIGGAYYGGPRLQVYGLDDNPNAWMGLGTDMSGGTYEHSIYFPNYSGNGRLSFGSYNGTTYAEKMCVNASGFVGIGSGASTADYQLKVSSSSIFAGGFTSSGGETILQVNNTAANGRNWFIISGGTTGSFSGGKFGIYNATNALEAFTISPVGNVGVGSINPLSSLGRTLTVEGTGIFQTPVGGGNYNENLRLNRSGNGYASIIIGGTYNSVSGYTTGQWALAATPSTMGYRFDFDYSGATVATINTSGGYIQVSDRNKKKDFEDSNIGLSAILGLKPTLYRMKKDSDKEEKQLGFIAQEVKEFIPQAYIETVDGFIGLHDRPIIAALVKAIQEQQTQIKELQDELVLLKNK